MKRNLFIFITTLCLFIYEQIEAQTLYVYQQPTGTWVTQKSRPVRYFITEAPPAFDLVDTIGPVSDPHYILIRGNWQWNGCQWVRLHDRCIPSTFPNHSIGPGMAVAWAPDSPEPCFRQWGWMKGY